MQVIQSIWDVRQVPNNLSPELRDLIDLENRICLGLEAFINVIEVFSDRDDIEHIKSLVESANFDLFAGTKLSRLGYVKQTYSLWRSWYEQIIFALYFLEAPIHRSAWKVADAIKLEDSPKYRLMLHQLLSESGEKHAFALVYDERFFAFYEQLKRAKPSSKTRLNNRASQVLTLLSQGVHGTFRPMQPKSENDLSHQVTAHCLPSLKAAWQVVSEFWLLFLVNLIDLPPDALIDLSTGQLKEENLKLEFSNQDELPALLALNNFFIDLFK